MGLHLRFHRRDLCVEGADEGDPSDDGGRIGRGDRGRLAQLPTAQRHLNRLRLVAGVVSVGPLQRRGDLPDVSRAAASGSGALASNSSVSAAVRSSKACKAAGKYSRSALRSRCACRVRSQINVL